MYSVIFGSIFSEPFILKLGMLEVVSDIHTWYWLNMSLLESQNFVIIQVEFI